MVAWVLLFVFLSYWVLRRLKDCATLSNYLNIVGAILIVFPLYTMYTYSNDYSKVDARIDGLNEQLWRSSGVYELQAGETPAKEALPDIYYIILDGYTRQDVLQELYGYDNSEFIQALEDRGFYIAKVSRSNYAETVYSISSALNMTHITPFLENINQGEPITDEEVLKDALSVLVQQNRVSAYLKSLDYQIVNFDNGYKRISIKIGGSF